MKMSHFFILLIFAMMISVVVGFPARSQSWDRYRMSGTHHEWLLRGAMDYHSSTYQGPYNPRINRWTPIPKTPRQPSGCQINLTDPNPSFGDIFGRYSSDRFGPSNAIPGLQWPMGDDGVVRIPYHQDSLMQEFNEQQREVVIRAMQVINDFTCVQFTPWTNEVYYVYFVYNNNAICHSAIGMREEGGQEVTFGESNSGTCFNGLGLILHELVHTLGFMHEHTRMDRDEYIQVHEKNIPKEKMYNFDKYNGLTFGPYNTDSILHYGSFEWSKNGKPTITSKDGSPIGQRDGLSQGDITNINKFYRCYG